MNYEELFTDWEKQRVEACRKGFFEKDFSEVWLLFARRQGSLFADSWNDTLSKKEKKDVCAKMLVLYDDNEENRLKALKYLKGRGVYWDSEKGRFR